jgi:hypothetical protein
MDSNLERDDDAHLPRSSGEGVVQPSEWRVDPTLLSLKESAWRDPETLPSPFCTEVGRRILLAQLEFSEWVLRRVEKVQFERDRSVSRRVSVELSVRHDAPVFVDRDGVPHWLVPLSTMRRRTLVNLDLRDEGDRSITMLGLRLAQRLDQSVLRAAAAAAALKEDERPAPAVVDAFITQLVAGKLGQVRHQMAIVDDAEKGVDMELGPLLRDPVFSAVLMRLWRNFTLFVMLPVDLGRHRLLRMSFDEPTDWGYQQPRLIDNSNGSHTYQHGNPVRWHDRARMAAALGIRPTRVRFQIPAAESATSYHFEIEAPHGVRIVRANLLAGRPNHADRRVSVDHVVGHAPTVGLHAVEVPNGSLCRAQVDLRVPTRGWLTTVVASCLLIAIVMGTVFVHLIGGGAQWDYGQVTNVVLVLVTMAAGSATLIAQRDTRGVAARMVTNLRVLGTVAISLPVIEAVFLVYMGTERPAPANIEMRERIAASVLFALSVLIAALITWTWSMTWRDERRSVEQTSPWDMTVDGSSHPPLDYRGEMSKRQFDTPAVGIASAEGWYERYAWTDCLQKRAIKALSACALPPELIGSALPDGSACCACSEACAKAAPLGELPDRPSAT